MKDIYIFLIMGKPDFHEYMPLSASHLVMTELLTTQIPHIPHTERRERERESQETEADTGRE